MKNGKFSIGEKVFLINLKEEAVVQRIINDELIYVGLNDMEIPVFTSDVSKEILKPETEKREEKTRSSTEQKKSSQPESARTNSGIFLSFEPVYVSSGEISSFNIFLINDTEFPIDFAYYFLTREQVYFVLKKVMVPFNYLLLHSIEYDLLNEVPSVQLEVRDVMNLNLKGRMDQKIRPQNFFNKLSRTPIIQKETYQYKVQTQSLHPKTEEKKKRVEFDSEALKQMMMDQPMIKDKEVESPEAEIDLHIEVLVNDHRDMNASEKLQVQLTCFQQALERAIVHHGHILYAIHGVGSGKLKNEIHRLLKDYKEVRSFNNNFHPRYGYGATEIILK